MEKLRARGVEVHERPWRNFGHNRSEVFALARGKADWLLATDADMTWEMDLTSCPIPQSRRT